MEQLSGVGVLDKAVALLDAVEGTPASLTELTERTGLSRATAHRLAVALEVHHLLARDEAGRFVPGPRLSSGSGAAAGLPWSLVEAARAVLVELRDATGESTQLYARRGAARICVAAAERPSGLRDTVPVGARLPMTAGSAAQVFLAFDPEPDQGLLAAAVFDVGGLAAVRERGWAESAGEREPGLASVSAPVRGGDGRTVAALSLSGPLARLGPSPGARLGAALVAAAARLGG